MKKKVIFLTGIALLALISFNLIKNQLVKSIIVMNVANITGAPVHVDSVSLGILRHEIRVNGFKLYNPKGYPKGVLVDIPKIRVDYDPASLFSGKVRLHWVLVDLKEAVIVRDKDGRLNVDQLKVAQKKEVEEKASGPVRFQVDVLTLSIGRVVYKDLSHGEKPRIEMHTLNIKQVNYENITGAEQLVSLVLVESLKRTAIKSALLYGTATMAGIAFLPAGAAMVLTGDASVEADFRATYNRVFAASAAAIRELGEITEQDKEKGWLKGKVDGNDVAISVLEARGGKVAISVSSRKFFMPNNKIAGGVLYLIEEKLK